MATLGIMRLLLEVERVGELSNWLPRSWKFRVRFTQMAAMVAMPGDLVSLLSLTHTLVMVVGAWGDVEVMTVGLELRVPPAVRQDKDLVHLPGVHIAGVFHRALAVPDMLLTAQMVSIMGTFKLADLRMVMHVCRLGS